MGGLLVFSWIFLQQWLPGIVQDDSTLYGRKCNVPVSWYNPMDGLIIGQDML